MYPEYFNTDIPHFLYNINYDVKMICTEDMGYPFIILLENWTRGTLYHKTKFYI